MEVIIRKAQATDAQAIIDYCNQVAGESDNLSFGTGEFGINYEQEVNYLEDLQKSINCSMLVALVDQEIVGLASINGERRNRVIHNVEIGISIKQAYWNLGIGSKLLNQVIEVCRQTNIIENIHLMVVADNNHAISLYKKIGFKQVGRYSRYHQVSGQYKDVLIMEYLIEPNLVMSKYQKYTITIDRPIGYMDEFNNHYPINYGFIPDLIAGDGEEQDVYIIDETQPLVISTKYKIAVIHRLNDSEDKWVCASSGDYSIDQIYQKVKFIEQYFEVEIELL